jgi:hypothetical protein
MIKIAPSILAADPLNLERDVLAAEKAGCDWIHVDIMDAHFVPNLAYSPDTVRRLKEVTSLPLDVHLMMDHPETLADIFLEAGAEWRQSGCSMCLAMNPDRLAPTQRAASTSNRNFEGRQGPGSRTLLASPLTAAAAAVTGVVTDPRTLL